MKDIERERVSKLIEVTFQISHYSKIQDIIDLVKEKLRKIVGKQEYYGVKFDANLPMRLWLTPVDTRKNILYNKFLEGCKANPSFSYKLYTDSEFLEPEKDIKDYDILDDSCIIGEMR